MIKIEAKTAGGITELESKIEGPAHEVLQECCAVFKDLMQALGDTPAERIFCLYVAHMLRDEAMGRIAKTMEADE